MKHTLKITLLLLFMFLGIRVEAQVQTHYEVKDSVLSLYIVPPTEIPCTLEMKVDRYIEGQLIWEEVPVFNVVEESQLNKQGLIQIERRLSRYYSYEDYAEELRINVRIQKTDSVSRKIISVEIPRG